jgi:hypothetical protein
MSAPLSPTFGTFCVGRKTAAGGTAFAQVIPPFSNQGGPGPGVTPNVLQNSGNTRQGVTHITTLIYDIGTTIHTLTMMRPLNYTTFSAAAAASQAVVNITADPGVYANYKWPLPNAQVAVRTADNPIAANDYAVYQAADGTWVMDTVASVSTLAITMTTNVPTGGVLTGGLFYWFGISTDTDPATGNPHVQFDAAPAAGSGTSRVTFGPDGNGGLCALHPGDPLIIYSPNTTAAGFLQLVAGYYSGH